MGHILYEVRGPAPVLSAPPRHLASRNFLSSTSYEQVENDNYPHSIIDHRFSLSHKRALPIPVSPQLPIKEPRRPRFRGTQSLPNTLNAQAPRWLWVHIRSHCPRLAYL